jgi:hypothetical protein
MSQLLQRHRCINVLHFRLRLGRLLHYYKNVLELHRLALRDMIARSRLESPDMPRVSPFRIELSPQEAAELNRRAVRYTLPYFEVVRAKMILMAAQGLGNDEIAARLDTRREIVSQWRQRFYKDRLTGLEERARPGRPTKGLCAQR